MSNQPYNFSRVTAHDVISIHDRWSSTSVLPLKLSSSSIGNLRREPEPNNLLRYHSRLAVCMIQEPSTALCSSGLSLVLHVIPDR